MRLACLLCLLLASCQTPVELAASGGPSGSIKIGDNGKPTRGLLGTIFGSAGTSQLEPPPGVAIVAAGEGVRVDAHVQIGAPPVSTTSTITNQAPAGFGQVLKDWLTPKPDNSQPPPPKGN